MTQIDPADIRFASPEPLDANGRVFFWKEEVYRAIPAAMAEAYRSLLEGPHAEALFEAGLVRTEVTDLHLDGYALVLRHSRIPVVTYPTEWSGATLQRAALVTLDLSLRLDALGYRLQDAHPWNVLFDGTRAVFIDFSSIVPASGHAHWGGLREFVGTFLNPLRLMEAGEADQARALLVDPATKRGRRVTTADVVRVLLRAGRYRSLLAYVLRRPPGPKTERRATLEALRTQVAAIDFPRLKTRWSDYCHEEVDTDTVAEWMTKRRVTYEVLQRVAPKTLLDIGSNTGWFSKLAARVGARVTAFDMDEPSINALFLNDEASRAGILPLAMNFTAPTPAYGVGLRCAPATERLRCEMVLALAIVHHLVFTDKQRFPQIVDSLAAFSERYLLVEFIPKEDVHVAKMYKDSYAWYTTDAFIAELKRHFRTVEVLPSNPEPRVLLLCER